MSNIYALLHLCRRIAAVLFWLALIAVLIGSFLPKPPAPLADLNDKLLHLLSYFLLAGLASGAIQKRRNAILAALCLIVLGGVIELVQGLVGRDMSFFDEVANTIGVVIGSLIARAFFEPLRRRYPPEGQSR